MGDVKIDINLSDINFEQVESSTENENEIENTENNENNENSENADNSENDIAKMNRHTAVINDQPLGEDYLNYNNYANAFGSMVSDTRIALPITIGIFGKGYGKEFLLGKIREYININVNAKIKLKKKNLPENVYVTKKPIRNLGYEYIIIDFNAWNYSFSDVLWAGLVKEIHSKVEDRYGFSRLLRFFRFFIYPFRKYFRQKIMCLILYTVLRFIS